MNTIGTIIRNRRKELSLTQTMLARKCNVSVAAVSKWELDKASPGMDMLTVIASALEMKPSEFMDQIGGYGRKNKRIEFYLTESSIKKIIPNVTEEEVKSFCSIARKNAQLCKEGKPYIRVIGEISNSEYAYINKMLLSDPYYSIPEFLGERYGETLQEETQKDDIATTYEKVLVSASFANTERNGEYAMRTNNNYTSKKIGMVIDEETIKQTTNGLCMNDGHDMILSNNVKVNFNYGGNNICIIGGAGQGKTRLLSSNINVLDESFVIVDYNGLLYDNNHENLEERGFEVKVLDLNHVGNGNSYNPFCYFSTDKSIENFVCYLIDNSEQLDLKKNGIDITEYDKKLLSFLFKYMMKYHEKEDCSFNVAFEMLRIANEKENSLSELFPEVKNDNSTMANDGIELIKFLDANKDLRKKVLTDCIIRIMPFITFSEDYPEVTDTMKLEMIGEQKQAIFIEINSIDISLNLVGKCLFMQVYDLLLEQRDSNFDDVKNRHVRFMIDEYPNFRLQNLLNLFTPDLLMRMMKIGIVITCGSIEQMKTIEGEYYLPFMKNFPVFVFLEGKGYANAAYVSQYLNRTDGDVPPARLAINEDEILRLPNTQCLVKVGNSPIILDKKFTEASSETNEE